MLTKQKPPHASPCIGICTATALGDAICRGCKRTAEEVIRWNGMTIEEKLTINKRLNVSKICTWDNY